MRMFMPAAMVAGALLIAGPALADPASESAAGAGLVPEQAGPAPAENAASASGAVKEAPAAPAVRVVRGVHNTAGGSLPEPASWTLMIVGFGGMGAVLRSHRRAIAAAFNQEPQP